MARNGKGLVPTLKQKAWTHEYLRTGNATQSALKVYKPRTYEGAHSIGTANLHSRKVDHYMQKIFDKAGVSDNMIAESLNKAIEAGLSRRALKRAKTADSLRGLEMAMRAKDLFPSAKVQIDKRSVSLNLERKSPEELMTMLSTINDEIKSFQRLMSKNATVDISVDASENANQI